MQFADSFAVSVFVAALQTDLHEQLLFFRQLAGLQHATNTWSVGGDRLLHEDVLARLNRRFKVQWAETGTGGENHQIDIR